MYAFAHWADPPVQIPTHSCDAGHLLCRVVQWEGGRGRRKKEAWSFRGGLRMCACVGRGGSQAFVGSQGQGIFFSLSQGEEKGKKLNDMRKNEGAGMKRRRRKGRRVRGRLVPTGPCVCVCACTSDRSRLLRGARTHAHAHVKWKKLLPCGRDVLCYH